MASSKSKVKVASKRRSLAPSAPELKVAYKTAGRETMAAIEAELAAPSSSTAQAPSIEISESHAGRETMAAIAEELASETRPKAESAPPPLPEAPEAVEIFELLTFIVRGNKIGDLSTEALRRRFIEQSLLHRIPGGAIDSVERIEVTPWTAKGTMVVRVWCRA